MIEEKTVRVKLIVLTFSLTLACARSEGEPLAKTYRAVQASAAVREKGALAQMSSSRFMRDFGEVLGSVKGGFKESLSPRGLVHIGLGTGLILATYSQDRRIQGYFKRNHPLRGTSRIGDVSGTILNSGFPGLGVYAAGRIGKNRELSELGKVMFASTLIKWWVTSGLIFTVRRERPEKKLSRFEGEKASFPSGHVAGGFATATALNEFYGPRVGVPAYLFATFVGLSRLEDNKHYASDVVGGALVGTIAAAAVSKAVRTRYTQLSATVAIEKSKPAGLSLTYHF